MRTLLQLALLVLALAGRAECFSPRARLPLRRLAPPTARTMMMAESEAVTEAIKNFSNGRISKDALEEIVAREEGQRYEADAAAVILEETQRLGAAVFLGGTGLVTGGLLDGALAGGGAPWAPILGLALGAGAAYAGPIELAEAVGPIVLDAADEVKTKVVAKVDGTKATVTQKVESTVADVKATPSRLSAAAAAKVAAAKAEVAAVPGKLSSAAAASAAAAKAEVAAVPGKAAAAAAASAAAAKASALAAATDAKDAVVAAPGKAAGAAKASLNNAVTSVVEAPKKAIASITGESKN